MKIKKLKIKICNKDLNIFVMHCYIFFIFFKSFTINIHGSIQLSWVAVIYLYDFFCLNSQFVYTWKPLNKSTLTCK